MGDIAERIHLNYLGFFQWEKIAIQYFYVYHYRYKNKIAL
jgi:hypothetical protein